QSIPERLSPGGVRRAHLPAVESGGEIAHVRVVRSYGGRVPELGMSENVLGNPSSQTEAKESDRLALCETDVDQVFGPRSPARLKPLLCVPFVRGRAISAVGVEVNAAYGTADLKNGDLLGGQRLRYE